MTGVATVNIRRTVRLELRDALRSALPGVQVEVGWPGDDAEAPSIWLGGFNGSKVVRFIGDGETRRIYDDDWSMALYLTAIGPDVESSEEQMDELANAVEEALATNGDLGGVDGLGESGVEIQMDEDEPVHTQAGVILTGVMHVPFEARIQ